MPLVIEILSQKLSTTIRRKKHLEARLAFYDAQAVNESAVSALGDDVLKKTGY